ncbi:trypsin-like peptidase domain-containing protein [Ferrimonas sediminicola]|uniref:Trypsin-like peptidase domain-containing protein n=1 Tax=Ferrimonas sediminicola TaxID=2569538 RepID=A0A4V6WMR0_9GAMM|nr:serine protease [Ferrimonas sediminicola]TKB51501.1 trypsin-like peptidase domain-containing protein [Ferrimonas sediminicola]
MRIAKLLVGVLLTLTLAGCANTKLSANRLPKGVKVNKSVVLPVTVPLAYYLPPAELANRFYLDSWNVWLEPGKALEGGVKDAFAAYFSDARPLDRDSALPYGLLIDIDPKWQFDGGKITMVLTYKVYDAGHRLLREGSQSHSASMGSIGNEAAWYNATLRASQRMVVDLLNTIKPDAQSLVARRPMSEADPTLLVNMKEPVATGTGFYINAQGQALTAAHVLRECMVAKVIVGEHEQDARISARSPLLDLAVVDTGTRTRNYLPLRRDTELLLGEPVTNVGYPLQGILAASPNLTRGNVSSRTALKGSVGLFQFSAPIQPGSSGGPVVSDGGELLGVTVSTINPAKLIESGVLPQNVNFALNARYVERFLTKHQIPFVQRQANLQGDIRVANQAALSSVIKLVCYQ